MQEDLIRVSNDAMLIQKYDAACKAVLADKYILAWILKSVVPEYKESLIEDIALRYIEGTPEIGSVPVAFDSTNAGSIKGDNVELKTMTEGTTTFDIRFHALAPDSGQFIELIINIEAQRIFNPGYSLLKRGIFYCARLLSSQMGRDIANDDYGNLKKVYSIWICTDPPHYSENTINRYSIGEEHLYGNLSFPRENFDLLQLVFICLGKTKDTENSILNLLNLLLSSSFTVEEKMESIRNEFQIPLSDDFGKGVDYMCNLGEGIYQKGIDIGVTKGRVEGEDNLLQLLINLQNQDRTADFEKVLFDKEAREKFYKEFGLQK